MFIMLFARWIFPRMFTPEFQKSADIFLVYSLLVIPRLVFPQTVIMGRKRTHINLYSAIIELGVNIPLSLMMIKWGYNLQGVAVATFISFLCGRLFLSGYLWVKMKIKPAEYIPVKLFLIYSFLLGLLFVLIDHRIIDIKWKFKRKNFIWQAGNDKFSDPAQPWWIPKCCLLKFKFLNSAYICHKRLPGKLQEGTGNTGLKNINHSSPCS